MRKEYDLSIFQIAQAKANGLENAFVADMESLKLPSDIPEFAEKFDAVFSNSVIHWCKKNPAGVLESAKMVLKKGGRFVGELGGFMNCIGPALTLHCASRS
jgi:SAM-dependent methyltransferase